MIRTGQLELIACLTLLLSGSLAGCAASSIGDLTDDALASEEPPDDAGEEPTDDDEPATRDASTAKDASAAKDASVAKDASSADAASPKDAGTADAGTAKDASAPKDASLADASAPKDGGPRDAGTNPDPGQCTMDGQCSQVCVLTGVFPCCKADHSCGCTYLPGVFCL